MKLSIVIVSYNSGRFIEDNLQSLLAQSVPFREIVVVDNLSSDDSREKVLSLQHQFPHSVRLIALDYNSGYAGAANHGIGALDEESDVIVVANPDTIFHETFNARIIDKLERDKDIALLSPLLLRFDKTTVDSAGQACSSSLYPCERGFNQNLNNVDIKEGPVFSVCGAATVFRRSAVDRLRIDGEVYDEDFFIFWEDFDIGWRAQLLGLKVWFFPEAVVYHYRSGTLERNFLSRFSLALARPSLIKFHLVKNRILVLIKNFHWRRNFKNIPMMFLKDLIWISLLTFSSPKIIIPLMKSGKFLKRMLKKRKIIAKQMSLSDGAGLHE